MMRRRIFGGTLLGVLLLGTSAGMMSGWAELMDQSERVSTGEQAMVQIVEGSNSLGNALIAELVSNGKNVFISPYSIAMALSVLSSCSEEGEHVEELRAFLGCEGLTDEELRVGHELLMEEVQPYIKENAWSEEEKDSQGVGSVEIANSLYLSDSLDVLPEIDKLPELLSEYQAEVAVKPLDTVETMDEMNDWVNEKTHGMIDSILSEPLSSDVMMALMNAVYFKGFWVNAFDEEATGEQTFYGWNENTKVQMMHQEDSFSYIETEEYQIVCLPYYRGYEMRIYLPKDAKVCENWTDAEYMKELEQKEYEFEPVQIALSLPKFEMEYEMELAQVLVDMGLEGIFEPQVYDRISEAELGVGSILHKTALENDEHGTEAAAVTAVFLAGGVMEQTDVVEFVVDRPFYFTITDWDTGMNLFEGCIFDL